MKKSKLVAMLNKLEGDPEIVLWNGMVGDWMDISPKLVKGSLVRETLRHYLDMARIRKCASVSKWDETLSENEVSDFKRSHREGTHWMENPHVTEDAIKRGDYLEKVVFYIDAKPRGVSTWDRLGNIDY